VTEIEDMLRAEMHAAVDGEKANPGDLIRRVRRRRRRHALKAGGAAMMVAAVVAAVLGLTLLPGVLRPPQQGRSVPSWALPWPDHRNGSVPQAVLDWAARAWRFPDDWMLAPDVMSVLGLRVPPVIWYVGQTAADGRVVVVMFEADHRLVVGWADASRVMGGLPQPQCENLAFAADPCPPDPWTLASVPAPRPGTPGLAIGLNVHAVSAASILQTVPNPANWIVILTEPGVRRVTWSTATDAGPVTGGTNSSAGLAVADTGHITAPVKLTGLITKAGNALAHDQYVGIPGNGMGMPQLERPAPIAPLGGLVGSGQGDQLDQVLWFDQKYQGLSQNRPRVGRTADGTAEVSWHMPAGGPGPSPGAFALIGSCYGPAPLQLSVGGHLVGTMRCDNHRQVLTVPSSLVAVRGASEVWFTVGTSELTRWQLYLHRN
jgi:hypothetical protein